VLTAGLPAHSQRIAQSAVFHCPFSQPGCDTGVIRRHFVRSKPPGSGSPHWLTVATDSRRSTDCVRLKARNHGPAEAQLGLRMVFPFHATLIRIAGRDRSPPDFLVVRHGKERPFPRKPVTCGLRNQILH
jgi:hypothetical protein